MILLRKIFFLFCLLAIGLFAIAQTDSAAPKPESTQVVAPKPIRKTIIKRDSTQRSIVQNTTKDSSLLKDTLPLAKDSLLLEQKKTDSLRLDSIKKSQAKLLIVPTDTSSYGGIFGGLYIPINLPSVALLEKERNPEGKENLFYVLIGLVALIAFTKVIFPKYFTNMFSLFFQTTYRQKQAVEQLTNNKVSSFLLNIAFIVCLSVYATLILNYCGLVHIGFWMLLLYSAATIAAIYLFKFIFLSFIGWAFNEKDAMESYTFMVFLNNKMTAIVLLPFVFLIAFNSADIANVCLIITYVLLGLSLLYRYFVAMVTLRNELRFNALHFFLYLCGVEILPLLLIYKAVFNLIATEI